MEVE
ncbi:hypothetical protein BN1263460072 [Stenotrophomonas indicatrix]|jgi:hypothetical protein